MDGNGQFSKIFQRKAKDIFNRLEKTVPSFFINFLFSMRRELRLFIFPNKMIALTSTCRDASLCFINAKEIHGNQ